MSRYIHPKSCDWSDLGPLLPHLEVDDAKVTFTGVFDSSGEPIYRVQPPIGFGNDEEWYD